jgi:hypothetical protein
MTKEDLIASLAYQVEYLKRKVHTIQELVETEPDEGINHRHIMIQVSNLCSDMREYHDCD